MHPNATIPRAGQQASGGEGKGRGPPGKKGVHPPNHAKPKAPAENQKQSMEAMKEGAKHEKRHEAKKAAKIPKRVKRREEKAHESARSRLLVCRWFAPVCTATEKRLVLSLAAAGRFTSGRDGGIYGTAMALCAMFFVWLHHRRWGAPSPPAPEDTRETFAHRFAWYWSSRFGEISFAASTVRLFIAGLVILDTTGLISPELNVLSVPEVVNFRPILPYRSQGPIAPPPVEETLMPRLAPATRREHVLMLKRLRLLCVASWCCFVLVPTHRQFASAATYAIGAVAYCTLGLVGLIHSHSHSVQATFSLVLSLIVVVPDLSDDPRDARGRRAARWLRTFLLVSIISPLYFACGVSKLRYEGFRDNISGQWLRGVLRSEKNRQSFPGITDAIASHKPLCSLLSIGNQIFETIMPLAVWFATHGTSATVAQYTIILTAVAFHTTIFFFIGPNFIRLVYLLVLCLDPLGAVGAVRRRLTAPVRCEPEEVPDESGLDPPPWDDASAAPTDADLFRAWFSLAMLAGFLRMQLVSDYEHVVGRAPPDKRYEPYFPFPEYSMFTYPTEAKVNYRETLVLDAAVVIGLVAKLAFDVSRARSSKRTPRSHLS